MSPQLEVALRSFAPFTLDTRRRPRLWWLVSVLLHLAFLALLYVPLRHDFARVLDAGPLAPGGGGGGGGGRVAYIPLPQSSPRGPPVAITPPVETPPPVEVPAVPIPTPEPVVPVPVEPEVAAVAAPADSVAGGIGPGAGPGQGGGAGGGTGGGVGPGVGAGTGPGSGDGGGGGTGRAPVMRHMPIPPDGIPKEARGLTFRVTFFITAQGRVERIAVDPPIRDHKYAEKFAETMMNYRFRPALSPEGTPVASTYVVSVDL